MKPSEWSNGLTKNLLIDKKRIQRIIFSGRFDSPGSFSHALSFWWVLHIKHWTQKKEEVEIGDDGDGERFRIGCISTANDADRIELQSLHNPLPVPLRQSTQANPDWDSLDRPLPQLHPFLQVIAISLSTPWTLITSFFLIRFVNLIGAGSEQRVMLQSLMLLLKLKHLLRGKLTLNRKWLLCCSVTDCFFW